MITKIMITKIMITFSTWPISSSLDQSQPFLPPFKKQLWSLVLNIWGYPHWFWIYKAILSPIHWFRHMYCEWLSSTHYLQLSRMSVCWRCHLWTSVPLSLSYKYIVCWDRAFLQHIFDIFGSTSGTQLFSNYIKMVTFAPLTLLFNLSLPISNIFIFMKQKGNLCQHQD